jgi:hypothetical protein
MQHLIPPQPLTLDDLIDLHFLLEADELFRRLLAPTDEPAP